MRAIAIGAFDGLHLGHREVIERAITYSKNHELISTVLTFFPHPQRFFKGEEFKLLTTEEEKEEYLVSLGIDEIVKLTFDERLADMPPEDFFEEILISKLKTNMISVGFNFAFGKKGSGNPTLLKKLAERRGVHIEIVPPKIVMGRIVSSTRIRELLKEGRIEEATILLGRNYSIQGIISKGDGLGKKIGFPTINLVVPEEKLLPADGVYATLVKIDNNKYLGAMNIGQRPTVSTKIEKRIEVHIIDFEGEVYGKSAKVEILHRIRGERRFNNMDELRMQIKRDIDWIKKHCKLSFS